MPAAGLRAVSRVVRGTAATDGAGVELTRVIGTPELAMLDPFLLLDVFRSDDPDDYIAGFPPHPHRGFETVTYLLAGRMRHRDNAGHEGVIEAGGIQWMTAGRGIVHSEMPEQEDGLLAGFQLWVNLPASHKMIAPAYQEYAATALPVEQLADGAQVRVLAGRTARGTAGPVSQPLTEPTYLDVGLPPGVVWSEPVPATHNGFVLLYEGTANLPGPNGADVELAIDDLAVLARGDRVSVRAGDAGARFLLVSGRPLNEPVARGGPFVMNTLAELREAMADYAAGRI